MDAATRPSISRLLDSDDEWLPHHLTTLWRHREGRVLAGGAAVRQDEGGDDVRYAGVGAHEPVELHSPPIVFPENPLPASGVLVRRDAVLEAGGLDPSPGLCRGLRPLDAGARTRAGRGPADRGLPLEWPRGSKSTHRHGPREAHRQIVRSYSGRPWWSRGLLDRRETVAEWDDLRQALRERSTRRAIRSAAWIAARPTRLSALLTLLRHRRRVRRRSRDLITDGR